MSERRRVAIAIVGLAAAVFCVRRLTQTTIYVTVTVPEGTRMVATEFAGTERVAVCSESGLTVTHEYQTHREARLRLRWEGPTGERHYEADAYIDEGDVGTVTLVVADAGSVDEASNLKMGSLSRWILNRLSRR